MRELIFCLIHYIQPTENTLLSVCARFSQFELVCAHVLSQFELSTRSLSLYTVCTHVLSVCTHVLSLNLSFVHIWENMCTIQSWETTHICFCLHTAVFGFLSTLVNYIKTSNFPKNMHDMSTKWLKWNLLLSCSLTVLTKSYWCLSSMVV